MKKNHLLNVIHLYYVENDYNLEEYEGVTRIKRPIFSDKFLCAVISFLVSFNISFYIASDIEGTPQLVIKAALS
jgi:hypothetical protein